jgi:putative ABC transport system permease protein
MLLDMLMLGSGIRQSFAELLTARGYELRVAPAGTLPFDTEALIQDFSDVKTALLAAEGVEGVAPLLAANLLAVGRAPGAGTRSFFLGIDPAEQGVLRVVEGGLERAGQVLLAAETAERLDVQVGDSIGVALPGTLAGQEPTFAFQVAGIAEFVYAAREEMTSAVHLEDLQRLTSHEDQVSFAMVRLAPGAAAADVADRLSGELSRVDVVTVGGLVEQAEQRLSYFRQLALILGVVSLFVAVLLVGTVMAVSINDRYGVIAAMRAIGISRRSILTALTGESLALCAAAGAAGLAIGLVTAGYLESILSDFPGLPRAVRFFVLSQTDLALGYGAILLSGAVAAFVPAWRAMQLHIVSTLHTDEP